MEIHLARDGSALGIFSEQEVRAGLALGRFQPSDLAWRAGMAAWTPLAEWAEFAQPSLPQSAPSPSLVLPAWERAPSLGAFLPTMREVILSPVRTFDGLPKGDLGRVIGFQYAAALPSLVLGAALTTAAVLLFSGMMDRSVLDPIQELGAIGAFLALCAALGCGLVLMPFLLFIGAALIHLFLLPWSPAGGFLQTYRAYGYVTGAFLPFSFIPCLNYLSGIWSGITTIIALSRVHRLDWWKVLISLLLPVCLLVALALLVPGFVR